MRININIPDDLITQIDERAEKLFLSRSAYVSMTMARAIQQDNLLDSVPEMLDFIRQFQGLLAEDEQQNSLKLDEGKKEE